MLLALLAGAADAADKVDVVYLKNGDRLTCEIKELDRSQLSVSTDALGTVTVHWGEIAGLTSPRYFDLQLASGAHYYGQLMSSPPGQLTIALDGQPQTVAMSELIRLAPIGASFWNRVDGGVDAGFSFAQANVETHWTLNSTAQYRSPKYLFSMSASSQLTTSDDSDRILRNTVTFGGSRSLDGRWYTIGWGQVQQNEELSLDLRVVAGGGIGRDLVHTTRRLWSAYSGLAYTHERFTDEPVERSIELAVGGQLEFFSSDDNGYKVTNSVLSYFNVSGRSRVRVELQSAWRQEFLSDFYWSFSGFESFDGDPPADQKNNDFGVSLTLGWKF